MAYQPIFRVRFDAPTLPKSLTKYKHWLAALLTKPCFNVILWYPLASKKNQNRPLMLVPKTLKDINHPRRQPAGASAQGLHRSSFVVSEIRTPRDIKIDRQLRTIFSRLNQSYSTTITSPHATFLRQQIDDFRNVSQTAFLFSTPSSITEPDEPLTLLEPRVISIPRDRAAQNIEVVIPVRQA